MRSVRSKDGSSSHGDSKSGFGGRDVMMLDGQSSSSNQTADKMLRYGTGRLSGRSGKDSAFTAGNRSDSMSDKGSVDSFHSAGSDTVIERMAASKIDENTFNN